MAQIQKNLSNLVCYYALVLIICSCGGGGGSSESSETPTDTASYTDVRGSILGVFGGQAQMAGWVLAAVERDTGIARVTEVDGNGIFVFQKVNTAAAHTIVLLSPNYIVTSVLSMESAEENTIKQFFFFRSDVLPTLIDRGRIITFQNLEGIEATADLASDQDADGKPDGLQSLSITQKHSSLMLAELGSDVDTDEDGTMNHLDADIDGDGLINAFDPDDDGDAILDVLDRDANEDTISDSTQTSIDLFFKNIVEWIAVQYELDVLTAGADPVATLSFTTKLRPDVVPNSLQIRGPNALLNGSTYKKKEADDQTDVLEWDRLLNDDGKSQDSAEGDKLFAQKITLSPGKVPRAHQSVFFQVVMGDASAPWSFEFPFTFPNLTLGTITAQYDSNTRSVQMVGNPFGSTQDFIWMLNVFDKKGVKVYTSEASTGENRIVVIPASSIEEGEEYTFKVVAQVLDKVPGYPAYISSSQPYDLE